MFHSPLYSSDPVALQSSGEAQRTARKAQTATEVLGNDVERLLMITEALWMLLKQQHGYSDEDLQAKIMEIDMRDGKLDGKVAKTAPMPCPKCGRPMAKRRTNCIYCGEAAPISPFER